MSIAFESHEPNSKELDEVSAFAGVMEQRIRSIGLSFRPSKETVLSVVKVFSGSGSLSAEVTQQQFEDAIADVATEMHSAFCTYISYKDIDWYLKYLRTAERVLSVADAMLQSGSHVENAEKIITSLFLSGSKEAPQEQRRTSERLPQPSARSSKPFKTIAIILAVVACLVGICAAISSKDRGTDAPATTESTTQSRAVRQAESTTNSTTIVTKKHSASSVYIDYDETVYVETTSKRFHRASCSVKDNSKEMIAKMTRREAVKNKNNPCSACFHD